MVAGVATSPNKPATTRTMIDIIFSMVCGERDTTPASSAYQYHGTSTLLPAGTGQPHHAFLRCGGYYTLLTHDHPPTRPRGIHTRTTMVNLKSGFCRHTTPVFHFSATTSKAERQPRSLECYSCQTLYSRLQHSGNGKPSIFPTKVFFWQGRRLIPMVGETWHGIGCCFIGCPVLGHYTAVCLSGYCMWDH